MNVKSGTKHITLDDAKVNRIKNKIIEMEKGFLNLRKTEAEKVNEIKKMIKDEVLKNY